MDSKTKKIKQQGAQEGPYSVAEVFSLSRDIDAANPYHDDGDLDMYTQQNIQIRQRLKQDKDIWSQIQNIVNLYSFSQDKDKISQQTYKKFQTKLAIILRPQIEQDELNFVVHQDWILDSKEFQGQYLTRQKLRDALFQMVDVWTIGNSKQQYISFCKLLKKKLQRALKISK